MNCDAMFSSKTDLWSTPQSLFDRLNLEFSFTLDPCATDQNHKCDKYYTIRENGLDQSWSGEVVFCNPPYGRVISYWIKKAYNEVYCGTCPCVVLLVPARTDTSWFHEYIYKRAEVRFLRGRLYFGGSSSPAPFPSMVVIFRK